MNKHSYTDQVRFSDIDHGGVLFHVNYLKLTDSAKNHFFDELGLDFESLLKEDRALAVKAIQNQYHRPLRRKDQYIIESYFKTLGGASLDLHQEIFCKDKNIKFYESTTTLVFISLSEMKAKKIPEEMKNKFENFLD